MEAWQVEEVLKQDALGRVELLQRGDERLLRRVACGGGLPGSRLVARILLARERRALRALEGLGGAPHEVGDPAARSATSADGRVPRAREVLVRSFIAGAPLHRATHLPRDFFEHLDALVEALHARGVCHNDLHKEQNIVVAEDGAPHLIDFQLASVHRGRGRLYASRVRDDLRHVEKHRRRYTRDGRGPEGARSEGRGRDYKRGGVALVWRRTGKPLYNALTRGVLRTRDGEERRPESGPWPEWTAALGELSARRGPGSS